jgi:aminoglycoside phosphotransferase
MIALVERALRAVPGLARPASSGLDFLLRDGGAGPRDTAQAIVFSGGVPIAVAKVARGTTGRAALHRERSRLVMLEATLLTCRAGAVPRPLAWHEEGEFTVLVESHVPGVRLKDLPAGTVERQEQRLDAVLDWLADFTVAAGVERVRAKDVASRIEDALAAYRAGFELSASEDHFLGTLVTRLGEALGPDAPLVAAHGDFSDANILVAGSAVAVIDWDEPGDRALPGADLFHLLVSLVATRSGLRDRAGFERGFHDAFLAPSDTSRRFHRAWERYRQPLGLPAQAGLPLFAAAWVEFAVRKLQYLAERDAGGGSAPLRARDVARPQDDYPVTFFAAGRCLNLALTAEHAAGFAL